ncbi:phosphatase PAP2 family protein [Nocardia sp. NBC_01499]|uniref:phosphatase PAP2 family protein n=1 Tax=Nocardia sp. NBC_01499 TaxID=2903597 RepID=UPI0038691213
MSAILEFIERAVTEVRTEATTAEIALCVGVVALAVIVASVIADRVRPPDSPARTALRRAVRGLAVVAVFVELSVHVAKSGWLTGADVAVLDWFVGHRSPGLTAIARAVTSVGSPAGVAIIGVLLAGFLGWRRRSVLPTVLILGIVVVAAAASTITKLVVGRARPAPMYQLMTETDLSYPSGHVTGTAALAGAVLLVYLGAKPTVLRGTAAALLATVVVLVVALTRLYLGVHWLTDVVGGSLLGSAVVLLGAAVQPYLRSRSPRRPVAGPAIAAAPSCQSEQSEYSRL